MSCQKRARWVHAMNQQPMFVNGKNFFTPELRRRIATPWQDTVLSTHGNNNSYAGTTAMQQNRIRCMCENPWPSYNAGIPIIDYPTY